MLSYLRVGHHFFKEVSKGNNNDGAGPRGECHHAYANMLYVALFDLYFEFVEVTA